MPTYATAADCTAYMIGLTIDDPTNFDKIIEYAERDVDSVLGAWPKTATGLKFDPANLTAAEATILKRATCAQVEYRLTMGEQFFIRAQRDSVSGPDFNTQGRLPYIGPKVLQELEGSTLVRLTTSFGRGDNVPPWLDFSYNTEPIGDYVDTRRIPTNR